MLVAIFFHRSRQMYQKYLEYFAFQIQFLSKNELDDNVEIIWNNKSSIGLKISVATFWKSFKKLYGSLKFSATR